MATWTLVFCLDQFDASKCVLSWILCGKGQQIELSDLLSVRCQQRLKSYINTAKPVLPLEYVASYSPNWVPVSRVLCFISFVGFWNFHCRFCNCFCYFRFAFEHGFCGVHTLISCRHIDTCCIYLLLIIVCVVLQSFKICMVLIVQKWGHRNIGRLNRMIRLKNRFEQSPFFNLSLVCGIHISINVQDL